MVERIKQIIEYYGINTRQFEQKIFASSGQIYKYLSRGSGLNSDTLVKILENCPEISPDWLLLGKGKMLRKSDNVMADSGAEYFRPQPQSSYDGPGWERYDAAQQEIGSLRDRATIRKFGRAEDSQERYDRFLRWFERWGGMVTWQDVTEVNIMRMDEALGAKMKPCSKWGNYHRFLNGFIIDAINEGIIRKNPYKSLHIKKDKNSDEALEKYLTKDEFERLAELQLNADYLVHARDLFLFQTYTCMAYVDLAAFDPDKITYVKGRPMYVGRRGKTNQKFTFMLLPQAMDILERYGGKLPIMTNQKYNEYIKMIAVMAGINKPVSSHWARHTGATLLLNSGVEMEVVSRVLGHSSTRMTRLIYAKMLDDTIADAMTKMI